MANIYSAFNLNWHSEKLEISELNQNISRKKSDISIINQSPANWPEINPSIGDTSFLKMNKNELRLEIENIGIFRATNGNQISWHKNDKYVNDKDIKTFLLGSMFGAILIQRDLIVMHGNALEKNGRCIVCLGFSGSGKSTLAYALLQKGWKFLSDDIVAITNDGYVLEGIPRLKLWEDSINAFGINKEDLPRVRNNLNKFIYRPESHMISKNKIKISSFYLINRFQKKYIESKSKYIEKINDEKIKLLFLRNNLYRARFYRGLEKEGNVFLKLVKLQKDIPVSVLNLPNKIKLLHKWLGNVEL